MQQNFTAFIYVTRCVDLILFISYVLFCVCFFSSKIYVSETYIRWITKTDNAHFP